MRDLTLYCGVAAASVIVPATYFLLRRALCDAPAASSPVLPLYGESRARIERFIFIDEDFVGVILGKGLRNVRRIEHETRTFINLVSYGATEMAGNQDALRSYENSCNWGDEDEVPMSSDKRAHFLRVHAQTAEQITLVELAIEASIADAKRRKNKDQMKIPIQSVGYVIGKGGDRIRKLSRQFRVRAVITQDGGEFETVTLEGTPEGIECAKTRILEMVDFSMRPSFEEDVEISVEEELRQMLETGEKLNEPIEMW